MPQLSLHTSLGDLTIAEEAGAIVSLDWGWGRDQTPTDLLVRARDQLFAYLDGSLTHFDQAAYRLGHQLIAGMLHRDVAAPGRQVSRPADAGHLNVASIRM